MSTSTSTILFKEVIGQIYSRRLLLHTPLSLQPTAATPPLSGNRHDASEPYPADNRFDANVVMVLSVLLCALICSLGLNSIIRCALRCSRLVTSESSDNPSARLANTGIKKKALKTFPIVNYSAEMKLPGLDADCVICLSEFAAGERVKVLPKCNHGFHVRCIDRWLNSHSSCPTCRHCLIETCQKIVGCSQNCSLKRLRVRPSSGVTDCNSQPSVVSRRNVVLQLYKCTEVQIVPSINFFNFHIGSSSRKSTK